MIYDSKLFATKQKVLKFSNKCREVDRQYEGNNNGQLDNGVYHKKLVQISFEAVPDDKGSVRGIEV